MMDSDLIVMITSSVHIISYTHVYRATYTSEGRMTTKKFRLSNWQERMTITLKPVKRLVFQTTKIMENA